MMKKILFIFTNYRICEKILNIPLELQKDYKVDVLLLHKMSFTRDWPGNGDVDPRLVYVNDMLLQENNTNIDRVLDGGNAIIKDDKIIVSDVDGVIDPSDYSLVIYDDNRLGPNYSMPQIYQLFKELDIPVVGNKHGNQNTSYALKDFAIDRCFDYHMCFGEFDRQEMIDAGIPAEKLLLGGIPVNDGLFLLSKYRKDEHIYVITNFLGNQNSMFSVNFDEKLIGQLGLRSLPAKLDLPMKIKIKPRMELDITKDYQYLSTHIPEGEVVVDDTGNNQLIKSKMVISSYSTLAFKAIQLRIPTYLIDGSGQIGSLVGFPYTNKNTALDESFFDLDHDYSDFIESRIAGGSNFTSTTKYIDQIKKIIK